MTSTQVTSTAIAVTLAVVVAGAFLFFGPGIFTPFNSPAQADASLAATTTLATTTMDTNPSNAQAAGAVNPKALPTKLTITDEVVGTGAAAKAGDTVTVQYVGAFPDGTVFDASAKHAETAQGFSFPLGAGRVIQGWDQGVVGMKVGGKRQLIVPPDMGYGPNDYGPIPGNSTLIFEVELLSVK